LTRVRVLLLPVSLAIELTLRCLMCDLHFKFEEDRTKTAVAIESDRYFGRTDKHLSDFISVQCHTDNNKTTTFIAPWDVYDVTTKALYSMRCQT